MIIPEDFFHRSIGTAGFIFQFKSILQILLNYNTHRPSWPCWLGPFGSVLDHPRPLIWFRRMPSLVASKTAKRYQCYILVWNKTKRSPENLFPSGMPIETAVFQCCWTAMVFWGGIKPSPPESIIDPTIQPPGRPWPTRMDIDLKHRWSYLHHHPQKTPVPYLRTNRFKCFPDNVTRLCLNHLQRTYMADLQLKVDQTQQIMTIALNDLIGIPLVPPCLGIIESP